MDAEPDHGRFFARGLDTSPGRDAGSTVQNKLLAQVHYRYSTNVLTCNLPFANVLIALCFRVLYRFLA